MAKATADQIAADTAAQDTAPEQAPTEPAQPSPAEVLADIKSVTTDLVKQIEQLGESPGLNFIKQKYQEALSTIDREVGGLRIQASLDAKKAEDIARRKALGLIE